MTLDYAAIKAVHASAAALSIALFALRGAGCCARRSGCGSGGCASSRT